MKTALRMNDSHFAMSIYEEAGDVYFKGHRNQIAALPFYRVRGCKEKKNKHLMYFDISENCTNVTNMFILIPLI